MDDTFGKYLRHERARAGLSLRAASKALELSLSYLWRVEHGEQRPGLGVILAAIRVLGIDSDHAHRLAGRIPEDVRQLLMHPGAFDLVRNRVERES